MPKIKVDCQSKHSAEASYQKVKQVFETDPDLRKLDSGYQCKFSDSAMSGTAKGSKFNAELKVVAVGAGSSIVVEVELPLMLTPVKGMVEATLRKKLDKALA